MLRVLALLALCAGLFLVVDEPALATASVQVENRASGSATVIANFIGDEARLNEDAVRENVLPAYDVASDDAVAAKSAGTIFKTAHYASRLEKAGVDVARAESKVAEAVGAMRPNMAAEAAVRGRMTIDGVLVEYRAMLLPNGSVNVGSIFPVIP
jgi:hypothetical protein